MFRPLGRGVDLVQTRNERITLARNCEALIPQLRGLASSALELRFNAENAEIRRGLNKKLAQATLLKTHHFY